jgi:hypothetical protein
VNDPARISEPARGSTSGREEGTPPMSSVVAGVSTAPALSWVRPWNWMLAGLGSTLAALGLAQTAGQAPPEWFDLVQVSLVGFGALAAGIGVWQRCTWPAAAGLNDVPQPLRGRLRCLVAAVHGLMALAVSLVIILKFGQPDLPGEVGGLILLWLVAAPWCAWSAWYLLKRSGDAEPLGTSFETAVLVTLAGLVAFMGSWALYWPGLSEEWDSLRLFLAVLAAACFVCAPIVAASPLVRRLAVSGLIALHFAAILSVVIGMQPGPWILQQSQHWIFGRYLDFMYLNNGYRFYSPEPSPASQLWCRIVYQRGPDAVSRWVKLPDMDDRGHPKYTFSLQYTRRLALTESVSRTEPPPQMMERSANGELVPARFVVLRDAQTPHPTMQKLGVPVPPGPSLAIPMHPDPSVPMYQKPNFEGRQLLTSYARHLLAMPVPKEYPGYQPVSVKIYRVQHRIIGAEMLNMGADPWDPIYFLPYYNGQFDREGRLMDPNDPFLYWVLPILRQNENDPKSPLLRYVFKHAGDANWDKLP